MRRTLHLYGDLRRECGFVPVNCECGSDHGRSDPLDYVTVSLLYGEALALFDHQVIPVIESEYLLNNRKICGPRFRHSGDQLLVMYGNSTHDPWSTLWEVFTFDAVNEAWLRGAHIYL